MVFREGQHGEEAEARWGLPEKIAAGVFTFILTGSLAVVLTMWADVRELKARDDEITANTEFRLAGPRVTPSDVTAIESRLQSRFTDALTRQNTLIAEQASAMNQLRESQLESVRLLADIGARMTLIESEVREARQERNALRDRIRDQE